jgi:hypothetical protein
VLAIAKTLATSAISRATATMTFTSIPFIWCKSTQNAVEASLVANNQHFRLAPKNARIKHISSMAANQEGVHRLAVNACVKQSARSVTRSTTRTMTCTPKVT